MAITGKLEVTIKINVFPDDVRTTQQGWRSFVVDCDGQMVNIAVKPKMFKKLEDAQTNYPMWVAAITGKIGARTGDGFVLDSPAISVFERKPKEPTTPSAPSTGSSSGWLVKVYYYLTVGRAFLVERDLKKLQEQLNQGQGSVFIPDVNRVLLIAIVTFLEKLGLAQLLCAAERPIHWASLHQVLKSGAPMNHCSKWKQSPKLISGALRRC